VFILYTATKEVLHMMSLEDVHHEEQSQKSVAAVIFWIVLMNAVFSGFIYSIHCGHYVDRRRRALSAHDLVRLCGGTDE